HEVDVDDPVDVRLLHQRPELVRVDPRDERVREEEEGEPDAEDQGRVEDCGDPWARGRGKAPRGGDSGPWAFPDCGDTGFLANWFFPESPTPGVAERIARAWYRRPDACRSQDARCDRGPARVAA